MHSEPRRLVQWFPFGAYDLVDAAVAALTRLRVTGLRTFISWADWMQPESTKWFDYVISSLERVPGIEILPCLSYTPLELARTDAEGQRRTSYPPVDLYAFAEFTEAVLRRYGDSFSWIQLWNEPNWDPYWSWNLDTEGALFAEMITPAAKLVRSAGKRVALGGTTPIDYSWFARMEELGVLAHTDAIGFHHSPSWRNQHRKWQPLRTEIEALRALMRGFSRNPEIWAAEIGFSTWTEDPLILKELEMRQVAYYEEMQTLPTDRVYWYSLFDQAVEIPTDDELNIGAARDQTAYHFGMIRADGTPKPLFKALTR